jgi:hypothetical protein
MTTACVFVTLLTGYLAHLKEDSACVTGVEGTLRNQGREMRFGLKFGVHTGKPSEQLYFAVMTIITIATLVAAAPTLWYRIRYADPLWYQSIAPLWFAVGAWLIAVLWKDIVFAAGGWLKRVFWLGILAAVVGNGVFVGLKEIAGAYLPDVIGIFLNAGAGGAIGLTVVVAGLRRAMHKYGLSNVRAYVFFSIALSWGLAAALGLNAFLASGVTWLHKAMNLLGIIDPSSMM